MLLLLLQLFWWLPLLLTLCRRATHDDAACTQIHVQLWQAHVVMPVLMVVPDVTLGMPTYHGRVR